MNGSIISRLSFSPRYIRTFFLKVIPVYGLHLRAPAALLRDGASYFFFFNFDILAIKLTIKLMQILFKQIVDIMLKWYLKKINLKIL